MCVEGKQGLVGGNGVFYECCVKYGCLLSHLRHYLYIIAEHTKHACVAMHLCEVPALGTMTVVKKSLLKNSLSVRLWKEGVAMAGR